MFRFVKLRKAGMCYLGGQRCVIVDKFEMTTTERILGILIMCSVGMFLWYGLKNVLLGFRIQKSGILGTIEAVFLTCQLFHKPGETEFDKEVIACNRSSILWFFVSAVLCLIYYLIVEGDM